MEQLYQQQLGAEQQVGQQETEQRQYGNEQAEQQQEQKVQRNDHQHMQQEQEAQLVGPKGSLGEGMAGYATLNWDNAVIRHNNLCGNGPDGDAPTLVFGGLVQGAPVDIDAVIECGES